MVTATRVAMVALLILDVLLVHTLRHLHIFTAGSSGSIQVSLNGSISPVNVLLPLVPTV